MKIKPILTGRQSNKTHVEDIDYIKLSKDEKFMFIENDLSTELVKILSNSNVKNNAINIVDGIMNKYNLRSFRYESSYNLLYRLYYNELSKHIKFLNSNSIDLDIVTYTLKLKCENAYSIIREEY